MAEPEESGPAPDGHAGPRRKSSRPTTIAAAIRDVERQSAPLRAEMERREKLRNQIDRWAEPLHRVAAELGLTEEPDTSGPSAESSEGLPNPPPLPKPEPAGRPAFEVAPGPELLAAMRQAFPGFKPTGSWWFHAECELKDAHHRSNPEGHRAFCSAYPNWSAEDLTRHLEAEGRIPKRPRGGRRHKRTVDDLTVGQWIAAIAAKDSSFRYLSCRAAAKLGPFSPSAVRTCEIWIQMKAQVEAEASEKAERAEAELADLRSEDEGIGGLRRSSTKYGVGKQRTTRKELEHERDVADFLRSKGGQPEKKRAE